MATRPDSTDRNSVRARYDALMGALGYAGSATFFVRNTPSVDSASHVIRQALTTVGVEGVFALDCGFGSPLMKPIVYTAYAETAAELHALRRNVWSQGAVPFLLVVMPETVEICHGFAPPTSKTISVKQTASARQPSLGKALQDFRRERISSSITWRDFEIHRDSSVDNSLVGAIDALNGQARDEFPELENEQPLINALIGKFIYIYVLVDRGVLTSKWLASGLRPSERSKAQPFLNAIFSEIPDRSFNWSAKVAFSVFDVVDRAINGSVFGLTKEQKKLVPDGVCHLIHRTVRCGDTISRGGSQQSFFNVSFKVLRTETISAIYERFVTIEDAERKRHEGVFYTPPHLADHLLDRVESVKPIDQGSRILDPSAGSGIFLVGAFRRLMERATPRGGWRPAHIDLARSLLLKSIHGVEKHPQAANVCRFSLYLTLLEYVGRDTIENLIVASGGKKFLPKLWKNIRAKNAFALAAPVGRYTHVIGNPPWTAVSGQKSRVNESDPKHLIDEDIDQFILEISEAGLSFGQNRLSDLFTWLAVRRFAAPDAVVGLLLPTRSLVGRSANGFAHCLAEHVKIEWIGNLFHLRRKLFEGAEAPACVVVAVNRRPSAADKTLVYRPLLSFLPGGRKNEIWSLLASGSELRTVRAADLREGRNGWFAQTVLSEFDSRMHDALRVWSSANHFTLEDFLKRSNLIIGKGRSPAESNIPRGSDGGGARQIVDLSRADLARMRPELRGWYSGNVILIPRSLNQSEYRERAAAFPSTFNAVIPKRQHDEAMKGPIPAGELPLLPPEALAGFLKYLNSGVLRYFASLFGASYTMDKARVELNDLLALPCPFGGLTDAKLIALANAPSADVAILDAMEAGRDLRLAFAEYANFRQYFANAQVPENSQAQVTAGERDIYLARLTDELRASFCLRDPVQSSIDETSNQRVYLRLWIGKKPKTVPSQVDVSDRFLAASIVRYDIASGTSILVKSPAKQAWTIDQAVSDALAVTREIRRSQ